MAVDAGQGGRRALLESEGMGSSGSYSCTNIALYYEILKHPRLGVVDSKDFSLFSLQEKIRLQDPYLNL